MKLNTFGLTCAFVAVSCHCNLARGADPTVISGEFPASQVVAPIFGELFSHSIPSGFRPQHEQTNGPTYMRTMVLASDTDAGWTQRLLVSGTQDAAKISGLTPKSFAMQIALGFQQSCPSTFAGGVIQEAKIKTGHSAYFMYVACGTHTLTTTKAPTSETAIVAVVQGDRNYYSVQWSERSPAIATVPVIDAPRWGARLRAISPLLVCERKNGEGPPYPSCTQSQ